MINWKSWTHNDKICAESSTGNTPTTFSAHLPKFISNRPIIWDIFEKRPHHMSIAHMYMNRMFKSELLIEWLTRPLFAKHKHWIDIFFLHCLYSFSPIIFPFLLCYTFWLRILDIIYIPNRLVNLHPLFLFWKQGSFCDREKNVSKIWSAKSRVQKIGCLTFFVCLLYKDVSYRSYN